MKLEIIERGVDVILATRTPDNGFVVVPRKNEVIHTQGNKYVVREVNHYYCDDDFIEVLVDAKG
ncbi:hypothetical protein EXT67_20670 [Pectobacterium atrosepticum]|uniref:Uncharacterized protein n=1 Tax=Pectobacterium phage phiTE TaxID=1116482 RepID=K9L475_9CAUD|nr:hypothetical protein [Pectobacterium atrosepticum]YP_007392519.1 hypothetical protein phiTE_057 [Pectobacterium phage phiTE]AEZ66223.1 hypothetical protein phiTE_057 [Pectobacterium phage phiTE]MCL6318720.1 hypothetical protein [Pectobacterium atrosepticum]